MPYHIDVETRSREDLPKTGSYRYAECPDCRILMAAISHDDEGPWLWVHPDYETDTLKSDDRAWGLFVKMTTSEELIFAHNAQFERAISLSRMGPDLGFPGIDPKRWRCTAAMCRKAALPDSLELAAQTLGLSAQKDKRGKALIKLFSEPNDQGEFNTAQQYPSEFAEFGAYCLQDVRVERELHKKLAPYELAGIALDGFLLDITLNDRGIPVNVPALRTASRILKETYAVANADFVKLTGLNPTQREKVRVWCNERMAPKTVTGVVRSENTLEAPEETISYPQLENMQGETLDNWLGTNRDKVSTEVYRAVQMYSDLNFAAAKKVDVMLACVGRGDRVRGGLLWHGAGPGRTSGRLIQPQNFKKPTIKNTDIAYQMICDGCTKEMLEVTFGNPLEVIASCIRHFIHVPGKMMDDADYNAIEARTINWLAGQNDVLELFRAADNWKGPADKKPDPYKTMAGFIYAKDPSQIGNPSPERDVGKTVELGAGFGLGEEGFYEQCQQRGLTFITEELASRGIRSYRDSHYHVVQFWYACEHAAKSAILQPGRWFNAGDRCAYALRTLAGIPTLLAKLPSGRCIAYPHPEIQRETDASLAERIKAEKELAEKEKRTPKQIRRRESLSYWGNIKGQMWGRIKTWNSCLAQNITQGTAGDILVHGMCEADRQGFELFTTIHDQTMAVHRDGQTVPAYAAALTTLPPWADGLPLKAEAKLVPYYKK